MTNLQPLITLLAHSERQRDIALADMMKAQVASTAAEAQSEQLRTYRCEYEQRWSAQFSREGQMQLVNCYQGFMERLTLAVEGQGRVARQLALQLERLRTIVAEHELQVAAVRKLLERRAAEFRRAADRVDQKHDDELAARITWGRRAAANRPTIV